MAGMTVSTQFAPCIVQGCHHRTRFAFRTPHGPALRSGEVQPLCNEHRMEMGLPDAYAIPRPACVTEVKWAPLRESLDGLAEAFRKTASDVDAFGAAVASIMAPA